MKYSNHIKKKIKNYEVISFDIFDTLIKRNVPEDADIFDIVYTKFSKSKFLMKNTKFRKDRIKAENIARSIKNDNEEITMNDIYNNLTDYNNNDKKILFDLEEETELKFCTINLDILPIYKYAVKSKKEIIIVSDMYLSTKLIKNILNKNNINDYSRLFLSSEINKTKSNGNLFEYVKNYFKNKSILHIGDNIKSDFINAKKKRIASIHIKKKNNKLSYSRNSNEYISNFINNNINFDANYFYKFGYECLGPILFSYSQWLESKIKCSSTKKVFFLARDGNLLKKSYDLIYHNSKIKTEYIYASRRGYIVPSLNKYNSIKEMLENIFIGSFVTPYDIMIKLGINKEIIKKRYSNYNIYNVYNNVQSLLSDKSLTPLLRDLYGFVIKNSLKEENYLIEYLKKHKFLGNVSIVDIGWFGHMQKSLYEITKDFANIDGYYMGINSESNYFNSLNMYGYLFFKNRNKNIEQSLKTFTSMFELLFTDPRRGSFIKFEKLNDKLVPLLKKYEYNDEHSLFFINEYQKGALDFIRNYSNSDLSTYIKIDENEAFSRIAFWGENPSKEDIYNFSKIHNENENSLKFLNPKGKIFYLFHINKLFYDLSKSWIEGFLYKLFKIRLPYYKFYNIAKKIKNYL